MDILDEPVTWGPPIHQMKPNPLCGGEQLWGDLLESDSGETIPQIVGRTTQTDTTGLMATSLQLVIPRKRPTSHHVQRFIQASRPTHIGPKIAAIDDALRFRATRSLPVRTGLVTHLLRGLRCIGCLYG